MGLFSKKEEINPLENKSAEDLYGSGSFQAENLENSLMNQDEKFKKNQKDIRGRGEKEVNLKRYKDPEGLTVRKMTIGLWFVEHRKMMINTFYGLLVLIGVATWGLFFYTFGSYLLFGIREDQLLLKGIIERNIGLNLIMFFSLKIKNLVEPEVLSCQENKSLFCLSGKSLILCRLLLE